MTGESQGPSAAPTGSRGMDSRSGLVLGALLLVTVAAAVLRCPMGVVSSGAADLSIPSWSATEEETAVLGSLLTERLKRAEEVPEADVRDLLGAYEAYNLMEVKHGDASRNTEILDAWADYEQWALSSLTALGAPAYLAVGARLGERVIAALESGATEDVQRLAGRFASHTRATGLTGPDDRPLGDRLRVLRVALMDRWCRGVVQRRPPAGLMSREERELLLRWKLAANPLLPPPRRVEVAKELRQMESAYPVVQALAARAASEGQLPVALQLYRAALDERPGDRQLQANIDHLVQSVETGGSP